MSEAIAGISTQDPNIASPIWATLAAANKRTSVIKATIVDGAFASDKV